MIEDGGEESGMDKEIWHWRHSAENDGNSGLVEVVEDHQKL